MSDEPVNTERVPTIKEAVDMNIRDGKVYRTQMVEALVAREDAIADALRMAGSQLGLYPEIVAKVLMDVGIGSEPSPEMVTHVNQQYVNRMEWLQQQYRDNNGGN